MNDAKKHINQMGNDLKQGRDKLYLNMNPDA